MAIDDSVSRPVIKDRVVSHFSVPVPGGYHSLPLSEHVELVLLPCTNHAITEDPTSAGGYEGSHGLRQVIPFESINNSSLDSSFKLEGVILLIVEAVLHGANRTPMRLETLPNFRYENIFLKKEALQAEF